MAATYSIDSFAESSNSHLAVDRSVAFASGLSAQEHEEVYRDLFGHDDALVTLGGSTFQLPITQATTTSSSSAARATSAPLMLQQLLEQPEVDDDEGHHKFSSRSVARFPYNARGKISTAIQSPERLFLERLGLHELLHTPRPNLLEFYQGSRNSPRAASDSYNGASGHSNMVKPDPRVEEAEDPMVADLTGRGSGVAKKDGRLAHLETIYGVCKPEEPRKPNIETFKRLANPILGYNSTLEALSPERRKHREWVNPTSNPIERARVRSNMVYGGKVKPLNKAKDLTSHHRMANKSQNQCEEELHRKQQRRNKSLDARMAQLREKLLQNSARDPDVKSPKQPQKGKGTFLTQEEDKELSLYERIERLPRPPTEVIPKAPNVRRPSRIKPQVVAKKVTKPIRSARVIKSTASTRAKAKTTIDDANGASTNNRKKGAATATTKRTEQKRGNASTTTTSSSSTTIAATTTTRNAAGFRKKKTKTTPAPKPPVSILDKGTSELLCSELLLMGDGGLNPIGCSGVSLSMPVVTKAVAKPTRPNQAITDSSAPKRLHVRLAVPSGAPIRASGKSKVPSKAKASDSKQVQLPVL